METELTDGLFREGLARDLVRHVQEQRKAIDCRYTDRIEVGIVTEAVELRQAVKENRSYIAAETLATRLDLTSLPNLVPVSLEIAGHDVSLYVRVVDPHRRQNP